MPSVVPPLQQILVTPQVVCRPY